MKNLIATILDKDNRQWGKTSSLLNVAHAHGAKLVVGLYHMTKNNPMICVSLDSLIRGDQIGRQKKFIFDDTAVLELANRYMELENKYREIEKERDSLANKVSQLDDEILDLRTEVNYLESIGGDQK